MRFAWSIIAIGFLDLGALAGQSQPQEHAKGNDITIVHPPGPEYFSDLPPEFAQEAARYRDLARSGHITQERYGTWAVHFMERIDAFKQQRQNLNQLDSLPDPYKGMR